MNPSPTLPAARLAARIAAAVIISLTLFIQPAAAAPAKSRAKTAPKKTAKSAKSAQQSTKKKMSAEEQEYWDLARRLINAQNDPPQLQALAADAAKFADDHKNTLFGARAIVLTGDVKAALGDFKGALGEYRKADPLLRNHRDWKDSRQHLSYVGLRIGDALVGMNNRLNALTEWKNAFMGFPDCASAGQIVTKIVDTTNSLMPPEQSWVENNRFLSSALRLTTLTPEVRTGIQLARLQVLAGAAGRGFFPPGEMEAEIDQFLAEAPPPGQSPVIDKARPSLERIRAGAQARAAEQARSVPPQNVYRKLSEMEKAPRPPKGMDRMTTSTQTNTTTTAHGKQ